MKQTWAAPERNRGPILEVLRRVLPASGRVLELASGSGQHAAFFAAELPSLSFEPSDVDDDNLASIRAWVSESALPNLAAPRRIDVRATDWRVGQVAAVLNANMIHIAPWHCAEGLFAGVERHLRPGGRFVLYGPFRIGGEHTAESNARFDEDLRRRDPSWGVRELDDVATLAVRHRLSLLERVAMPANNQTLVFERQSD